MDFSEIARRAFRRHGALHPWTHYTGILTLQAAARLALITEDLALLEEVRGILLRFVRGELPFKANFTNYYCGGNGTAYLLWRGHLPEAANAVRQYADDTLRNAPRDPDGIFSMPNRPRTDLVWIDVAFAVTPFLLFAGLTFDEDAYIEEAYQQTAKMVALLRNPDNGLLHQARGFVEPGRITEDHWSRGNGWGILALAELIQYLPADDPRRPESERMFADLAGACLTHQDAAGMWHQEMTDLASYVETSGTGLILYALGAGLETGLLPDSARPAFINGLRGYREYIREDGTIYHTCKGNLSPGDGSIAAYKQTPPVINDPHAFGPAILAYGQALCLGLNASDLE